LVAAFDAIVGQRIGGLLVGVDILLFRDRRGWIALAVTRFPRCPKGAISRSPAE
jgi:hypothetical protein